jgi:hypothetical protein
LPLISKSLILLKSLALNRPLVNIEPFRTEIVPGVFLSGVPLGTNVIGFSFIDIRDANDQEISTWTCYDPITGKENLRIPQDIADMSPTGRTGWIICNNQEVVLKNGNTDEYSYTANPPPLRKITKSIASVPRKGKVNLLY